MENFNFICPTKIIFGKGTENRVGEETKKYSKKVLFVYGSVSIKKTGLYDKVVKSLSENNVEYIELSGVKPNPRLSLVYEGINKCRENDIDFILAVGGGSVIDTAKAIAVGALYDGDVWDFFLGKAEIKRALPVGVILTLAATGSEASDSAVITNEDGWYKKGIHSDLIRPQFAIMNPELLYTLPAYQTAAGAADIMAHIMERYFTNVKNVDLTDRLCEATLKTVINNVPKLIEDPTDYDARAEVMWAGTIAHNGLLDTGRIGDWASHRIEHELSAIYDIAHGAGLAIIFPAWMKYVYKHDLDRFVQFAVKVWDVDLTYTDREAIALEGIKRLENFFRSIGLPVTLKDANIPYDKFAEMANKCTSNGTATVGQFVKLGKEDIINIYNIAR
ncbi:butanol dehydrogenase [Thermoanaerobacterium thermosaccharolyticum]|uniref:Iron-containing alcohol dehydrogenase n=1 Tax=Thermoanaerobacterium thermosaccharolyticum TaxID=1517 RepID=A0A223HXF4_THETR|nr:iron-containing alcohol dehydrogenase [Thermoanaerobacterium thermosaccharolyticum]AST57173.1 iron-containing alcohol dehydrogenase [Thermoanaerobacterium thermosaccharolyticum]PHO07482.1 butanol dehydrogenase [Thermoanaerobacterium thermosaccharolyticum]